MKWWIAFDSTKREVLSREIDLKNSRFQISRTRLLRISYGCSALLVAAATAYYFDQLVVMGIALFSAVFLTLWQIIFYGYGATRNDEHMISATRIYGKGTLIFLACFWTILIVAVTVTLYLKARAL